MPQQNYIKKGHNTRKYSSEYQVNADIHANSPEGALRKMKYSTESCTKTLGRKKHPYANGYRVSY